MEDMPMLTYAGLGMVTLGIVGYFLYNIAKKSGALDDRVIRLLQEAVKPYQDNLARSDAMLDEEREEKRRAQDERDKLNATLVQTILDINGKHEAAVALAAKETRDQRERDQAKHQESLERAHKRIDECERGHRIDQQTLAALQGELREVRDRLFQVAQNAPPGAFAAPLPIQPSVTVPHTGLTITPGMSPPTHPA